MGAVIESWPAPPPPPNKNNTHHPHHQVTHHHPHNSYLNDLEPIFNTFVLNVNSNDGVIMEKVYGACIIFYERFERELLTSRQLELLFGPATRFLESSSSLAADETVSPTSPLVSLHSNKCLLILSRNPLFDTYKSFLLFLLRKYTAKFNSYLASYLSSTFFIPIERYICRVYIDIYTSVFISK